MHFSQDTVIGMIVGAVVGAVVIKIFADAVPKFTPARVAVGVGVAIVVISLWKIFAVASSDEPISAYISKIGLGLFAMIVLTTAGWSVSVVRLDRKVAAIEAHLSSRSG